MRLSTYDTKCLVSNQVTGYIKNKQTGKCDPNSEEKIVNRKQSRTEIPELNPHVCDQLMF